MKNIRTPRTLADSEFAVGHAQAVDSTHAAEWVVLAIAFAAIVGFFAGWLS